MAVVVGVIVGAGEAVGVTGGVTVSVTVRPDVIDTMVVGVTDPVEDNSPTPMLTP